MSDPTPLPPPPPQKPSTASRAALLTALVALIGLVVSAWMVASDDNAADDESPSGSPSASATNPTPILKPKVHRYVALGDSMTSAPYLPVVDPAGGCNRSSHNYPSLLAQALAVADLVDVSCGGASTEDMTRRQFPTVAPQLQAVTPQTDLVTLTMGGNDFKVYGITMSGCARVAARDPEGSPCRAAAEASGSDRLFALIDAIGPRLEVVLEGIRSRAPDATVVLVGYPRMVPTDGTTCPATLPFASGDYAYIDQASRRLRDVQQQAADRAGVEFLDLYAASEGHDACSTDAWINGMRDVPQGAARYHTFPSGQQAIADQLLALLR